MKDRTQNTEPAYRTGRHRLKTKNRKIGAIILIMLALILFNLSLITTATLAAEWGGVDESVVEKYAAEHGREARESFINTDQGDLLLFVFLLAGAVGGFIGGYYWKELMDKAPQGSGASGHKAQT